MISKSTILLALVVEVVAGTTPGLILLSRYVPYWCYYSSMLVLDLCK